MIEAATRIAERQDELARRSTELVYAERPELAEAYGPGGRRRCELDARFHTSFLLAAVAVGDATVFEDYARWTRDLLTRHGLPPGHLVAAFRALADAVEELLPDVAATARPYLRSGEAAVGG